MSIQDLIRQVASQGQESPQPASTDTQEPRTISEMIRQVGGATQGPQRQSINDMIRQVANQQAEDTPRAEAPTASTPQGVTAEQRPRVPREYAATRMEGILSALDRVPKAEDGTYQPESQAQAERGQFLIDEYRQLYEQGGFAQEAERNREASQERLAAQERQRAIVLTPQEQQQLDRYRGYLEASEREGLESAAAYYRGKIQEYENRMAEPGAARARQAAERQTSPNVLGEISATAMQAVVPGGASVPRDAIVEGVPEYPELNNLISDVLVGFADPLGMAQATLPTDVYERGLEGIGQMTGVEITPRSQYIPPPTVASGTVLGDVTDKPALGFLVDVSEILLGNQRLGYSAADEAIPLRKQLGIMGSIIGQSLLLAGVGAPRGLTGIAQSPNLARAEAAAAANLTPAGTRLAYGATLGEVGQLRTMGTEDPMGLVTAPLAGGGGALLGGMPMSSIPGVASNVAANTAYDFVTAGSEFARYYPDLANSIVEGTATEEEIAIAHQHFILAMTASVTGSSIGYAQSAHESRMLGQMEMALELSRIRQQRDEFFSPQSGLRASAVDVDAIVRGAQDSIPPSVRQGLDEYEARLVEPIREAETAARYEAERQAIAARIQQETEAAIRDEIRAGRRAQAEASRTSRRQRRQALQTGMEAPPSDQLSRVIELANELGRSPTINEIRDRVGVQSREKARNLLHQYEAPRPSPEPMQPRTEQDRLLMDAFTQIDRNALSDPEIRDIMRGFEFDGLPVDQLLSLFRSVQDLVSRGEFVAGDRVKIINNELRLRILDTDQNPPTVRADSARPSVDASNLARSYGMDDATILRIRQSKTPAEANRLLQEGLSTLRDMIRFSDTPNPYYLPAGVNYPGGIQPSSMVTPITPRETPKSRPQILTDFLNIIRKLPVIGDTGESIGLYFPGRQDIVVRDQYDFGTLIHEYFHWADDTFGLLKKVLANQQAQTEIMRFSATGSPAPPGFTGAAKARWEIGEGLAEFGRALMTNPTDTMIAAPNLLRLVRDSIKGQAPDAWEAFMTLGRDVRDYMGTNPEQRLALLQETAPFNRTYREFFANWRPILGRYFTRLADQMFSSIKPGDRFQRQVMELYNIQKLLPQDDPILLRQLMNGQEGRFTDFAQNQMTDLYGNPLIYNGKPTGGLVEFMTALPYLRTEFSTYGKQLEFLSTALIAQRAIGLAERYRNDLATLDAYAQSQFALGNVAVNFRAALDQLKASLSGPLPSTVRANTQAQIDSIGTALARLEKIGVEIRGDYDPSKWGNSHAGFSNRIDIYNARQLTGSSSKLAGLSDESDARAFLNDVATNPAKAALVAEAHRRYQFVSRALVDRMVQSGYYSRAEADRILASEDFYARFERIHEDVSNQVRNNFGIDINKRTEGLRVIYERSGGTQQIQNVFESLGLYAYSAIYASNQNMMANALFSLIRGEKTGVSTPRDLLAVQRGMRTYGQQDFIGNTVRELPEDYSPSNSADVIRFRRAGDDVRLEFFDPLVREAFFGGSRFSNQPEVVSALLSPIALAARMIRAGVIYTPPFAIRNIIRDTLNRTYTSLHGTGMSETARAFADAMTGRLAGDAALLDRFGGGQATIAQAETKKTATANFIRQAMNEMSRRQQGGLIMPLWNGIPKGFQNILQFMTPQGYLRSITKSETVGRVAEFRAARRYALNKLGYNEFNANLYAAYNSRVLLDYAEAGSAGRALNKYIPFFNAAIQGYRRMLRTMRNVAAGDTPGYRARFARAIALYSMLPTLLEISYTMIFGEPDEWAQLPAHQRNLFWNFKIPDSSPAFAGNYISIPKPFDLGMISASLVGNRWADSIRGRTDFKAELTNYARTLTPASMLLENPAVDIFDISRNQQPYFGTPIVPYSDVGVARELRRSDERASEVSEIATEGLYQLTGVDVNPNMSDQWVEFFGSQAGSLALDAVDVMMSDDKETYETMDRFLMRMTGIMTAPNPRSFVDVDDAMLEQRRRRGEAGSMADRLSDQLELYEERPTANNRRRIIQTARRSVEQQERLRPPRRPRE